jgi:hypothetical protein
MCAVLAAMTFGAGGCALLYLAGGKGKQKAIYQFSKTQKVLVLVETREGVTAPPYLTSTLADAIGRHLWKYHAVELPLVNQNALIVLQTAHPEEYKKMGVADIAQATGADAVLLVYVTQFMTPTTTDGSVGEGYAEVYVKVIDKKGTRLFPGDAAGLQMTAHDDEELVSDRDIPKTVQDLIDQLSTLVGRTFHDYDMEDKEMNPPGQPPVKQIGQ